MVKGVSRRVIVVKSPDPKLFDQAIFLLKEDALEKDGTLDKIVKEWSEKDDGAYSFLSETWCLNKQ